MASKDIIENTVSISSSELENAKPSGMPRWLTYNPFQSVREAIRGIEGTVFTLGVIVGGSILGVTVGSIVAHYIAGDVTNYAICGGLIGFVNGIVLGNLCTRY